MSAKKKTGNRKWVGIAIFAVVTAMFVLLAGRVATFYAEHGGMSIQALMTASGKLASDIALKPFHIDVVADGVVPAMAITAILMVVLAVMTSMRGERLDNEATGSEHGDDRLATKSEMRSLADKKHYCNNVLYSQNCHMAMKPHDKKTKAILDGRNLNCITLGISGLGKTYNLVWPDLMQSVGDALEPCPCGIRNVPANLSKKIRGIGDGATERMKWAKEVVSGETYEEAEEHERENWRADDKSSEDKGKGRGSEAGQQEKSREGKIEESAAGKPGEQHETRGSLGKAYARAKNARESYKERFSKGDFEKVVATGGYDVFNTDPKGDNVRDVGPLFEAAGYDVKVVDTIDFDNGLKFNPLAYIKSHAVDARPAEEVTVKVRAHVPQMPKEGARWVEYDLAPEGSTGAFYSGMSSEVNAGGDPVIGTERGEATWAASASFNLQTDRWGLAELPKLTMTKSEIDEKTIKLTKDRQIADIKGDKALVEKIDGELDKLAQQTNVWWMQEEMGAYTTTDEIDGTEKRIEGHGCEKVADAMTAFTYRRSSGTIEVTYKNYSSHPMPARIEIELDEALVVDAISEITRGQIEWSENDAGEPVATGTVVWNLPTTHPKRAGARRGLHARNIEDYVDVCERLVLHVHVKTEYVPDGVDLTKIVDCLVTNLRGTDAKSNGSEDPFWEDTKRLCFMSLVAFTFERYGPKYRTLPEVMRLLDMALADTGNPEDPSPLQCLMEKWEYAREYAVDESPDINGKYATQTTSWKKADNIRHSRNNSLALHCYHAFMSGAPETVQSVIISCQACLVNLVTDEAKEFLSYDEVALDTLGDPDQKQVIFCVTKDTNSPFDFITALLVYLAIDLAQDKAYKRYGGKLPRHVRFVLDEAANIGKIPILIRALAVVRSRNISISMYLQSKAQLALVYGEKEADVIFDNCTTIVFLGAQTKDTLDEMSEKVGNETVQTRRFQRSFNQNSVIAGSTSESIQSNERRVMSASKMGKLEKGYLMLFIFNMPAAIYDHKYKTRKHPYYAYINPGDERGLTEPPPRVTKRFDYREYRAKKALERSKG